MEFLIYEHTDAKTTIESLNPTQLYHWVNGGDYIRELQIQTFTQNAKLGESIMSEFEYGYLIVVRVK